MNVEEKKRNLSFQAGFGILDYLAIQGSFFHVTQNTFDANSKLSTGSIAIGGFYNKKFERTKGNEKTRTRERLLDTYLGMAYGKVNHDFLSENSGFAKMDLNYIKLYVQTGIHLKLWKVVKFAVAFRVNHTNYIKAHIYNDIPSPFNYYYDRILENDPFLNIEFIPRLDIGYKYGTIYFTNTTFLDSFSLNFIGQDDNNRIHSRESTTLLGITLDFDEFLKIKKRKKSK